MAAKSKSSEVAYGETAADQFVFVEVPAPSNDNSGLAAGSDDDAIYPDVMLVVGEYIYDYDFDDADPSSALMFALDGAEADAAEYAAFSSSVMFVFGDAVIEA